MPISKAGRAPSNQRGFSYAVVLVAIVIVAVLAETAYLATARVLHADREAELLFRGQAYRRAIQSYYDAGNPTKTFPPALEHLLNDPRTPGRHHLRTLYRDPFTKDEKNSWRLVRASDGGIAGVSSSSTEEPLKQANFPKDLEKFAGAKNYAEWIFEYRPPTPAVPPLPLRPTVPASPPPAAPPKT